MGDGEGGANSANCRGSPNSGVCLLQEKVMGRGGLTAPIAGDRLTAPFAGGHVTAPPGVA